MLKQKLKFHIFLHTAKELIDFNTSDFSSFHINNKNLDTKNNVYYDMHLSLPTKKTNISEYQKP